MRARPNSALAALTLGILVTACATDQPTSAPDSPLFAKSDQQALVISPALVAMNDALAARGVALRIDHAEWIVDPDGGQDAGQIVFANNRTHHIGTRWIPADPNRGATGNDLTYLVDQSDGNATGGLTNAQTEAAIDRSFATWNGQACGGLRVVKVADPGVDPDIVDELILGGTPGTPSADITEAGWLPAPLFDALAPGGSGFILAVTFTFIFVDDNGNPVDTDNDHYIDTALKEVYYNNTFPWAINGRFDVETVALHENGHVLEIGHFGKIFRTVANGALHFAPRAVMNAAYGGVLQAPLGTDNASFCSLFGSWPH